MKNIYYLLSILTLGSLSFANIPQKDIPQSEISNGLLKALIYLPDTVNGYYRGTRFDWSGNMPSLSYSGHEYFGQWYTKYSPEINDVIMGPVEDFSPLGYAEAKPGDSFIKIGVGVITKTDDKPYAFSRVYSVKSHGNWIVKVKPDGVQFNHELHDKDYSYQYNKTIQLVKDKPEMVLVHTLKNTGKSTIETSVYDHNFFVIDKQAVGPGLIFTFPFKVSGEGRGLGNIAKIEENRITFLRRLAAGENVYCGGLEGFSQSSKDYNIKIENQNTGAGVRITCDQPLLKLVFWSCPATACSEPYIKIKVDPGQEFSWTIRYEFYTLKN
jgi:hypothetical protein